MRVDVPPSLEHLGSSATGRAWLKALPALVAEIADGWALQVGTPFPGSNVSLVVPVQRADGSNAVLKIQFPHRESAAEAAALAHWSGDGAVRLLDHDAERHALLIERCQPGDHLSTTDADVALEVLVGLLRRLWKPAGGVFETLADEARRWYEHLPNAWRRSGGAFDRRLLDVALELLETLPGTQREPVLLHQDLHADNVLRAEREPWLVIDPKPLAGEREFGVAPIVRSYELGHSRRLVFRRLDRLTAAFGLDRERARGWSVVQTLAWAFEDGAVLLRHIETARWLAPTTIR